jgi:hypothetical protein
MGDLMVDQPDELSFTNFECGNTASDNYTEVVDDPNEDAECADLNPLPLIKVAK